MPGYPTVGITCTSTHSVANWYVTSTSMTNTPYKAGTSDGIMRYLDESGRGLSQDEGNNTTRLATPPHNWTPVAPWIDKFVDDLLTDFRPFRRALKELL